MQRETLIEKDEISDSRSVKNSAPTVKNTNSKKKTSWDSTKAKTSAALIALGVECMEIRELVQSTRLKR